MSLEKNLCFSGKGGISLRDSRADGLAAAAQPTPITGLTKLQRNAPSFVFTAHDWKEGSAKKDNVRRTHM